MKRQDFNFTLPKALIAQYPLAERSMSRLLCVDGVTGAVTHKQFNDLTELLVPGDLLVFNDTRVIPARLFAHKSTGGKVEILVERLLSEHSVLAQMRASKAPKVGAEILLDQQVTAIVTARQEDLFELTFQDARPVLAILDAIGHIPLPPYIERQAQSDDQERYQTVYARHQGAVAAPTAGLHFDNDLLAKLTKQNVQTAFVTLHVGAGTFQPVRVDNLADHQMHSEVATVSADVCQKIQAAKAQGKRVIAVGTTSVRSLETAAQSGELKLFHGETDIFIYPGYQFQIVDGLITNFHLPESTLFMLVCAFAGLATMQAAYQEAIEKKYRFFSYGDANFLLKGNPTCNSN